MALRWQGILPWVVVSALACVGCKKDEPTAGDGGIGADGTRSKRAPARVEAVELDELGVQPGMLADGAIFAAVRAGSAQDFLRQIPLPGEVTRELAEARRELGFDPLTDDVLARFAISPDAVVSMTLGRAVGTESRKAAAKDLRTRDERFLGLVTRVLQEEDASTSLPLELRPEKPLEAPIPSAVPVEPARPMVEEPKAPEPIVFAPPPAAPPPIAPPIEPPLVEPPIVPPLDPLVIPTPPPPPPEPIDPAERRQIDELLRHVDGMAIQFRIHIPTDDPSKLFGEIRTRAPSDALARGEALCRGLGTELCLSGGHETLVARRDDKAVVLDMLFFLGRSDRVADPEVLRRTVSEALAARRAELPVLSKLAGHAAAYVDAAALVDLFEHERIDRIMSNLRWGGDDTLTNMVREQLDRSEQLRRMLDGPRPFDGVIANVHHERDRTQLQVAWPLREGESALALAALAPPPLVVPVPSLAALCDGALFCARSRGLPSPQEAGTKLGVGIYADPERLDDAFDASEDIAAMVLLASTWPNAIGTILWHLPLAEARGPEGAIVRGLLDALGRIQGMGLSVRRLDVGRRTLAGEYALYARVPVNDLGLVGTLLAMAEQRMTPTTVEGVTGTVAMLRVPEDDIPAVLMTREDPDTVKNAEGKEVRYGWLTLVDGTERLKWLLDLPTDDGQEPLLYGEIPELWRLVATVPEAVDELGFARTWATERSFKAALSLDEGQPRLLFEVALHQGKAAEGTK